MGRSRNRGKPPVEVLLEGSQRSSQIFAVAALSWPNSGNSETAYVIEQAVVSRPLRAFLAASSRSREAETQLCSSRLTFEAPVLGTGCSWPLRKAHLATMAPRPPTARSSARPPA